MCGIVGIFTKCDYGQKASDIFALEKMHDEIKHRGNDEINSCMYPTLIIGHRRLSITNIEEKNNYFVSKKSWSVFLNGEIYNYKELGYKGTEKEVLEAGFYEHGIKFVEKLNGMFFIVAIKGDEVNLIRDRYGIKPCYYYETEDTIIFSSEIKPILSHPDYKFKVNTSAKNSWLTYNNTFTNDTLFDGIKQVPKATCLHLNTGAFYTYWEWKFTPTPMGYEEAKRVIRFLFHQSIKRQTPTEVKFGTCLSGGLDSNIINKCLGDVYTFSAGFTGGNDERSLAELSSKKHYEVVYNNVRHFKETINSLEDLRVGASWSNYGLYELASKFVKVLFDGAGGDELFGGYSWRYDMSKKYCDIINRTGKDHCLLDAGFSEFDDTIENRFKFDADHFLPAVLSVVDKLSMAHTIEVRLPFLDNDLVDFCLTLPNEYKENKKILRDAFRDVLHGAIIEQPKRGFSSPDWIPGDGNQANKWAVAAYNEWEKQFNK